jgi:hypothetical protein
MKAVVGALVIAASLAAIVPSPAYAWYCTARSNTGQWGWGRNFYRGIAVQRALNECSIRTPRYGTCYSTGCS